MKSLNILRKINAMRRLIFGLADFENISMETLIKDLKRKQIEIKMEILKCILKLLSENMIELV